VSSQNQREAAPWIEALARVGFVAKGLLYGTIGVLAGCAGLGEGGETTDTRGAMARVLDLPFGRVLLIAMAVGLVGYALWRFVEGIADPDRRGSDPKGLTLRASYVTRGLVHLWLAYSAMRGATGHASNQGSGERSREATATAMRLPAGEWVVWAVAIGICCFGLFQLYKAFTAKLNRDVSKVDVKREAGAWLIAVSRVGIGARGVVFVVIGWLLTRAAQHHDPGEAGGIGDALDALTQLGRWPFLSIAVGLIAYAVYQLLSARYRRIRAA
jgi:hypothetical protein